RKRSGQAHVNALLQHLSPARSPSTSVGAPAVPVEADRSPETRAGEPSGRFGASALQQRDQFSSEWSLQPGGAPLRCAGGLPDALRDVRIILSGKPVSDPRMDPVDS